MLPGSLLGKALHHATAQWPKLERYVKDGTYPIDNNVCENAIRPFVVGRRNWLFADTVAGANASANLAPGVPLSWCQGSLKQLPCPISSADCPWSHAAP